jgi:hypothetical protein
MEELSVEKFRKKIKKKCHSSTEGDKVLN